MLNKQPIHVVQRDCKQWSLQAVDVLQALCWQSLVSSVGMQLLNVDENQKRRCRTVSSYISIYHMILENYFDNCVCFTFCIFLGIAVLVSHCCYSSLYGIVMGCHRHCLNRVHWIIDSTEFPSKGVINFRHGHCPPGALPNLPAAQPGPAHPHWILRGDQINCDQLRNPTQHLALAIAAISAAWLSDDLPLDVVLYSCIYIIYIYYIYILIYAKCFSMAAKCLKDLKVIYVMEVF